jgi:ferric-dicitrate binding protein FerR (iron transport regulator)
MNRQTTIWIDSLLAGTIGKEDFARLQAEMKRDPVALRHYCEQSEIHGRLEWELGDPKNRHATVHVPKTPESLERRSTPWILWLSGAAAAVGLVLGLAVLDNRRSLGESDLSDRSGMSETPAISPAPASPVARLTNSRNTRWDGPSPGDGAWLSPSTYDLRSGSAEITFDSGARIILQGPARLTLENAFLARLERGKAIVSIPSQAAGFRLETPSNSFSDQDSSFAVAVAGDGTAEVHVLRGLVEATPRANPELARLLSKNESISLTKTTLLPPGRILYSAASFQKDLSSSLFTKPAQFLHWPLDSLDSGDSPESGRHSGESFPASLYALPGSALHASADLVEGKFGKAAYFNGRGAFLSTPFPGIAGAAPRTVAFWVRIPQDAQQNQAYSMVAWGASENTRQGDKWQIAWNIGGDNRGVPGAIRTEFGGGFVIGATDLRDSRWHHVASVFLGGKSSDVASRIRHYVDGRLEAVTASKSQTIDTRLTTPAALPTYFGCRLERDSITTGFKGALDEIFLIPAALTPEQIDTLYRTNTPPKWLMPALGE